MSGFFSSSVVQTALIVGTLVAALAGGVGVFTVIRSQAFSGEALGDVGSSGGAAATLWSIGPTWGFLGATVIGATLMELIGTQRARERDLATGIVLGLGFGLAALFFYLDTTHESASGATVTVLFGSLFVISHGQVPVVLTLGAVAAGLVCVLYRPLLLSSLHPVLARVRGVPVRLVALAYLGSLAVTVSLCAVTVGAILSTALLVGPAATALRLTTRPGRAVLIAASIGVLCVWGGIVLAYDSYHWPDAGWPVSFFVVTFVLIAYVVAGLVTRRR
jgi:zinc/manganese transport system permease protein